MQGTAVDSKFDLWWGPLLQHLHRPVAIAGAVVDSSAVFSARASSQKTATVDPRVCLGVNLRGAIRAYLHVESLGDIWERLQSRAALTQPWPASLAGNDRTNKFNQRWPGWTSPCPRILPRVRSAHVLCRSTQVGWTLWVRSDTIYNLVLLPIRNELRATFLRTF